MSKTRKILALRAVCVTAFIFLVLMEVALLLGALLATVNAADSFKIHHDWTSVVANLLIALVLVMGFAACRRLGIRLTEKPKPKPEPQVLSFGKGRKY